MDVLDILVCPRCREPLAARNDGTLSCASCRRPYPIVEGIPVVEVPQQGLPLDQPQVSRRESWSPEPGYSTAVSVNVDYRLGKIGSRGLLKGTWLDCGCAEGGYAAAMATRGPEFVIGVETALDRLLNAEGLDTATGRLAYVCASSEGLPFATGTFDGVLLNEVLEHVADESRTLREIYRVLRPGGYLVVMSPNRWFPFEGHGMRILGYTITVPVPLLPWLPAKIAQRFLRARNYWPGQLRRIVAGAGFRLVSSSGVLPVFQRFRWLPAFVVRWYRRAMPALERVPIARAFGVSTFVLAQKPPTA